MLKGYDGLPEVEQARSEAREVLGADFIGVLDEGPAEKLNQTLNTQPAMVTAGYAAYRAWRALGGAQPEVVAGTAWASTRRWSLPERSRSRTACRSVRFRAQSMQEAVPRGRARWPRS
jgi:[acyl-carrier-protein] S-malonyltransferase